MGGLGVDMDMEEKNWNIYHICVNSIYIPHVMYKFWYITVHLYIFHILYHVSLFHILCFILYITQSVLKFIFIFSISQFIVSSLRFQGGGGQVRCTWTRLYLVRSVLILENVFSAFCSWRGWPQKLWRTFCEPRIWLCPGRRRRSLNESWQLWGYESRLCLRNTFTS